MNSITIVQHNVQSWGNRTFELTNIYRTINPDIILINSFGIKTPKIRGYNTYSKNQFNEAHDGAAILIRQNIKQN